MVHTRPARPVVLAIGLFAGLVGVRPAWPQGLIVDRRPQFPIARTYEVRDVTIDARIRDQVAEVQVSQTFHNPGSTTIESEYLFPVPDDGGIQNFVLLVDGVELPGKLLPKDEARRIYEEIVRTKRDPALLEYMGRGVYKTSVFPIPAGADRKVTLRYTQLCKRDHGVIAFDYPLSTQRFTARPIARLTLRARIEGREAIKSIFCPSYDVSTSRSGDREASVELTLRDAVPTRDFKLLATLADGPIGATVLSDRPDPAEDGYFLVLASPEVKPPDVKPLPKTVIFVLDRSGSMAGKKIDQARNALTSVLNNLRDDDTFNIIAYDDRVESFRPELQRYGPAARDEAARFVANIREGGSTNINDALKAALAMVPDESRPSYVLFLTDGLPTAGETAELRIAANAKSANRSHARVFAFGVGYDVNARLLDRISGGNAGTSEYVRPDEDIEAHVGAFYAKLTRPALSSIEIAMASTDVNRTYPRDIPDLFEGGQLVWAGRYRRSGPTTVRLSGKVGGERRTLEFPADLAESGRGTDRDFVPRIWAIRRVGSIIDQIDLEGSNRELIDELVALGTKYGIMTPYTSFLADDRVNLHATADNRGRAGLQLAELERVQGAAAVGQRRFKQSMLQATGTDLAAAAAPTPGEFPVQKLAGMRGAAGGAMGGPGGMIAGRRAEPGMAPASMTPAAKPAGAVADRDAGSTAGPRQIGAKTFFKKGDRWVDSSVKPQDEAKAKTIAQFSEEFFQIARAQSSEMNQYLSQAEPITVSIEGQVYKIDPPTVR